MLNETADGASAAETAEITSGAKMTIQSASAKGRIRRKGFIEGSSRMAAGNGMGAASPVRHRTVIDRYAFVAVHASSASQPNSSSSIVRRPSASVAEVKSPAIVHVLTLGSSNSIVNAPPSSRFGGEKLVSDRTEMPASGQS